MFCKCKTKTRTADVRSYGVRRVLRKHACPKCSAITYTMELPVKESDIKKVKYLLTVLRGGAKRTRRSNGKTSNR